MTKFVENNVSTFSELFSKVVYKNQNKGEVANGHVQK